MRSTVPTNQTLTLPRERQRYSCSLTVGSQIYSMSDAQELKQLIVNETKLAYRDTGSGDPVILIHGNISDYRTFSSLEQMLVTSGNFRVINYSRRYYWPNEPIPSDKDDPLDLHADDLIALITKLNLGKVHLVGNSSGAFIALLVAKKRPEWVRSMVLEEPPVVSMFLPSMPPSLFQVLTFLWNHPRAFLPVIRFGAGVIGPATTAFRNGDNDKALEIFGKGVLGETYYSKLSPERMEQMKVNLGPHRGLLLGNGLPKFLVEDAKTVMTPTLFLTGNDSTEAHKWIDRRMREVMPEADERVIQNASHLMHEDNTLDTFKEILAFITQHQGFCI